jgi:hypothetical protein
MLRDALSDAPDLELALAGVRDATYNYQLAFAESGRIPAGTTYDAADRPLATVESDYRQNSDRMGRNEMWVPFIGAAGLGNGMGLSRRGPLERTEYVSTHATQWQRFGQPHGEFANMYWTWSDVETYEPGETVEEVWWGPLTRPSVPPVGGAEEQGSPVARFHDSIRISVPHYRYGDSTRHGYIQEQLGDTSQLTLRRDGETVGTSTWPEVQFSVPAAEADFELQLEVSNGDGNWMDTSTSTSTTWSFRSGRVDRGRDVLPLVQLDYHLHGAGHSNDVPAGTDHELVLVPGYQPDATGPGEFDVDVEVSYDDGSTWLDAPTEADGDEVVATVLGASEAGFATIRVTATDADGNALEQRIDRAWRVGAAD